MNFKEYILENINITEGLETVESLTKKLQKQRESLAVASKNNKPSVERWKNAIKTTEEKLKARTERRAHVQSSFSTANTKLKDLYIKRNKIVDKMPLKLKSTNPKAYEALRLELKNVRDQIEKYEKMKKAR